MVVHAPARLRSPVVRLTILAAVVAMIVISLSVPLRTYVRQMDSNAALAGSITDREQSVAELQTQRDLWRTNDYVEQQARARLHFVYPGEAGYVVLGDAASSEPVLPPAGARLDPDATSWYTRLWDSVQKARD